MTVPLRPPRLAAGTRIALVAPAGAVPEDRIAAALESCRTFGLEPVPGSSIRMRHGYTAGPDDARIADLQHAIESPAVDAIWALRGGYGAMRLLPRLDLAPLRARPKAFIGFSDNTALHRAFARVGLVSFHAPHAGSALPAVAERSLRQVLFEATPAGTLPLPDDAPAPRPLAPGLASGMLTGGNLALLAALAGTPWALAADGCILVLEDVDEPPYRVDRMLTQLLLSGAFGGVRGIALGQFGVRATRGGLAAGSTGTGDGSADPVSDELFTDRLAALGVPILAGLPIGHTGDNWTLPLGVTAQLDADAGTLTILEAAVT